MHNCLVRLLKLSMVNEKSNGHGVDEWLLKNIGENNDSQFILAIQSKLSYTQELSYGRKRTSLFCNSIQLR